MSIDSVRTAFKENIEVYGDATKGIFADGGLMAHHDGVNSAVNSFWKAAEAYVDSGETTPEGRKEIDTMCSSVMNLVMNSHTDIEIIVGTARHDHVLNAL